MNLYFKQSLTCVYRNLSTLDYKSYGYYYDKVALVDDSKFCTISQINYGYFIEYGILLLVVAFIIGIVDRNTYLRDRLNWSAVIFLTAVFSLISMVVLNVSIMFFPLLLIILGSGVAITSVYKIARDIKNPLTIWKNYKVAQELSAQKKLNELQVEVNRLRSSDPILHESLKSLDIITTALND